MFSHFISSYPSHSPYSPKFIVFCVYRYIYSHTSVYNGLMWETWVRSLGQEDPLEKGMATDSSILAWRIPMDKRAWQATIHEVAKSQT